MLIPKLLPTPFAEEGRKNTIPQVKPVDAGAHLASFELGFPPITMQPKADGGLPPDGMDFNGILYDLSAHAVYQNKGGQYKFDAEYAELIGGYPKGAILLSDDEAKQYISVSENNKDNFNDASSANWKVISLADIDVLLNDKVSSQTMADALNLKLDKTTYATLTQKGITQLTNTIDNSEDKAVTPNGISLLKNHLEEMILILGDTPVDQIFYFDSPNPPQGYIARNGQAINESTMPKLFARYGANMPDDRDRVHRMTGTLAGAVGTTQEDATQKLTGTLPIGGFDQAIAIPTTGPFNSELIGNTYGQGSAYGAYRGIFDNSFTIRTATEERVKSRIIIACNKIQ